MKKTISFSIVSKRIQEIHGDKVIMDESTYIGSNKKAKFIDKDFGEWWSTPGNVLYGYGNKKRGYIERKVQNTLTINEVENRLFVLYGDKVTLKRETYSHTHNKAIFIDKEFGEWVAMPYSVLSGHLNYKRASLNRQKTNFKLYGVPFSIQNHSISLKAAQNLQNIFVKTHWKTNKKIHCQASYESKVVDYLNANKIDYLWQPKTFKMPDGKTYRPDMFLIEENKWIEIKGYMRPNSLKKWNWFQKEFFNSELWDKNKLKELGIL